MFILWSKSPPPHRKNTNVNLVIWSGAQTSPVSLCMYCMLTVYFNHVFDLVQMWNQIRIISSEPIPSWLLFNQSLYLAIIELVLMSVLKARPPKHLYILGFKTVHLIWGFGNWVCRMDGGGGGGSKNAHFQVFFTLPVGCQHRQSSCRFQPIREQRGASEQFSVGLLKQNWGNWIMRLLIDKVLAQIFVSSNQGYAVQW